MSDFVFDCCVLYVALVVLDITAIFYDHGLR